jgi:hypothetical protein
MININNSTGLFYDKEEKTSQDKSNDKLFNRMINTHGLIGNNYKNITENIGLYQNNRSGMLQNIDNHSNMYNGKHGNAMTAKKGRLSKILPTRVFAGAPRKKSHIYHTMDADVNSKLTRGKMTVHNKRTDSLSGVVIDRFIPLVDKIRNNIKRESQSITNELRRGENTRNTLRSIRYKV